MSYLGVLILVLLGCDNAALKKKHIRVGVLIFVLLGCAFSSIARFKGKP